MAQVNNHKRKTVLWIATDANAIEAYEHVVDDECDCKSCESKKSNLVLPN